MNIRAFLYKNWPTHNIVAHQLMGWLHVTRIPVLVRFGNWLHDVTLPDGAQQ